MSKEVCLTVDDLSIIENEPRIKDIVLAQRLGLSQPLNVRGVIENNDEELCGFGAIHVVRETRRSGCLFRKITEYYLNEPQALLICMFSRTQKAAAVRKELIDVYMAYRTQGLTKVKEHYRQVGRKESLPTKEDRFVSLYKNAVREVLNEESLSRKEYRLSDYEAQVIEEMRTGFAFFATSLMLELEERLKK